MARFALRVAIAAFLVGAGWVVGQAQTPATAPDFEISIVAPAGPTSVTCVRGCEFRISRIRDGATTSGVINSFTQSCGKSATTCEIPVRGWVTK